MQVFRRGVLVPNLPVIIVLTLSFVFCTAREKERLAGAPRLQFGCQRPQMRRDDRSIDAGSAQGIVGLEKKLPEPG
jgi:hypothetical protein